MAWIETEDCTAFGRVLLLKCPFCKAEYSVNGIGYDKAKEIMTRCPNCNANMNGGKRDNT